MEKLYFEDEDSTTPYSESYFLEQMKEDGITEMTVFEAILDKESDYIYCTDSNECYEKCECGNQCESYRSNNGEYNSCEFLGIYYEFGEEITIKIS